MLAVTAQLTVVQEAGGVLVHAVWLRRKGGGGGIKEDLPHASCGVGVCLQICEGSNKKELRLYENCKKKLHTLTSMWLKLEHNTLLTLWRGRAFGKGVVLDGWRL